MKVAVGHLTADLAGNNRPMEEAKAELERELNLRIRMYPEWIASKKLSSIDAKDRLERLARACQLLDTLPMAGGTGSAA